MQRAELSRLAAFYRHQLLDDVIPFWEARTLDAQFGGLSPSFRSRGPAAGHGQERLVHGQDAVDVFRALQLRREARLLARARPQRAGLPRGPCARRRGPLALPAVAHGRGPEGRPLVLHGRIRAHRARRARARIGKPGRPSAHRDDIRPGRGQPSKRRLQRVPSLLAGSPAALAQRVHDRALRLRRVRPAARGFTDPRDRGYLSSKDSPRLCPG